ncbi:MAG TPA: VTT domain-containing protein, partial [Candidatus Kapabacteria bacterium]|nr:VTT domain-containing protein [Candidatus Kapabacteria bacterium]
MEIIQSLLDIILHLDKHLTTLSATYGVWMYTILFLIIFAETGLVVTPFLPGDSLLFAVGALCATGSLNIIVMMILLIIAAIAGDTVNYMIGHRLGLKPFEKGNSRIFKKEYLAKTERFYEKYGGKTIIIARFVPIVRT